MEEIAENQKFQMPDEVKLKIKQKQGEYFTFHENFLLGTAQFPTLEERWNALVAIIYRGLYNTSPDFDGDTPARRAALIADGYIGAFLDGHKKRRENRKNKKVETEICPYKKQIETTENTTAEPKTESTATLIKTLQGKNFTKDFTLKHFQNLTNLILFHAEKHGLSSEIFLKKVLENYESYTNKIENPYGFLKKCIESFDDETVKKN
jgi:hypothetical protein